MKQMIKKFSVSLTALVMVLILQIPAYAQEKVEVNGQDVGSWFSRHWIWITIGVIALIIIVLLTSSSSRSSSTTVVKDDLGNVKRISSTEVSES